VAAGERFRALFGAFQEMLPIASKRFFLFKVRNVHIAVVIGVVEFGEGVVMRRPFCPASDGIGKS
jgi:hypothetical protein